MVELRAMARWWPLLALALLVPGSFLVGRYSAPAKVVEVVKEREVATEAKQETRLEVRESSTRVAVDTHVREVRYVTRWREKVVASDGTTTERELETNDASTGADTLAKADTQESAATAAHVEQVRVELREVERLKVVERQPDWSVTALVGVAPAKLLPPSFAHSPLVVGGLVERRFLGPFSVGLAVQVPLDGSSPLISGALSLRF